MQMLRAKLYMMKLQEHAEKLSGIRGEVTEINCGNQIRSLVIRRTLWSRITERERRAEM